MRLSTLASSFRPRSAAPRDLRPVIIGAQAIRSRVRAFSILRYPDGRASAFPIKNRIGEPGTRSIFDRFSVFPCWRAIPGREVSNQIVEAK